MWRRQGNRRSSLIQGRPESKASSAWSPPTALYAPFYSTVPSVNAGGATPTTGRELGARLSANALQTNRAERAVTAEHEASEKDRDLQGKRQGPQPAITAEDGPCRTFNPMVAGSSPARLIRQSRAFAGIPCLMGVRQANVRA